MHNPAIITLPPISGIRLKGPKKEIPKAQGHYKRETPSDVRRRLKRAGMVKHPFHGIVIQNGSNTSNP